NVIKTEKELNENNSELVDNNSETELNSNESQVASEENTLQKESSQDLNVSNRNSSEEKNQNPNSSEKSNNTVIASSNSDKKNSKSKENTKTDLIEKNSQKNDLNDGMAISKNATEKINSDKKSEDSNGNIIKDKTIFDTQKEGFAVNENSEKNNSEKIDSEKNLVKTEKEVAEDSKNKKTIFDAIAENNEEEIVAEKTKKEKPEHRWNVAPNVAPVYYSSLENGSSIDPSFADNPQKGDVNMSYGVQVSYALNNRLSVRTGVNNVDLSYSTSGIEVGTGPVAYALNSVDYGGKQIVTTVVDKGSFATAAPSNGFGNVQPKSTQGDAQLIQNINYYEVPVELKYAVLDSKLGVNVIGGVSTLF